MKSPDFFTRKTLTPINRNLRLGLGVLWVTLACCTTDVSGAVLVQYNFTGSNDDASILGANGSATSLSIGVNGNEFGTSGGNGWSTGDVTNAPGAAASKPTRFVRSNTSGGGDLTTSAADAVTNNDFFKFTLTPDSGYQMSLTSFEFDMAATSSDADSYTANFFIRSSADNFASDIGSVASVTAITFANSSYSHFTIDLTGQAFQNLGDPLTFRIYTYASRTDGNGTINRIDNITVNGSVIPEPSTFAMLLGGAGCLILLCRRRLSRLSSC